MPICAATSFSGSSFACLATSRFFGIVMVSLISSVSGIDEPVDLYIVLVAGVDQRVEEILPRGPLAMQQVGALPVAVVSDDVRDQLRHGAAEGRPVGRYRLREVDGAHFRQKIGRPRVASKTLTSPSSFSCSTRSVIAAPVPGVESSSHSPGPEPTTSIPCASRAALPKGTRRARASSPSWDASTRVLARGVQSVIFSSAALRRALISQPCLIVVGGTGVMGLRAMGAVSTTLARPFGVVVRMVRRDGGRDDLSVGQLHGDLRPRRGEVRGDEAQADRTPQRGRHAARRYPPQDLVLTLYDLARLWGDERAVVRLQADELKAAVALALPRQLGLACEVVLVQLDHPAEAHIVGSCEPVGVLAYDKVSFLQAQDTLGLYAEGPYAQVRAALHERLPHVRPVSGGHVDLVAELTSEADTPHKATFDAGDTPLANLHVGEGVRREVYALGQAQEQLAGVRPGDVDARVRRGHWIDVDPPPGVGGLQPVVDPLPHAAGA